MCDAREPGDGEASIPGAGVADAGAGLPDVDRLRARVHALLAADVEGARGDEGCPGAISVDAFAEAHDLLVDALATVEEA